MTLSFAEFTELRLICEASDLIRPSVDAAYHEGEIDGHAVEVSYVRHKEDHHVSFTVADKHKIRNKQFSDVSPSSRAKALHFVGNKIDDYVSQERPHSISMMANEREKFPVYAAFAKKISSKHNGKVELEPLTRHIKIHFPKHKSLWQRMTGR